MRRMHPIVVDCVEKLMEELKKSAQNSNNKNEIELKKMMDNLTMDVISSCAFGTKVDVYRDSKNEFIVNAQKILEGNWRFWLFFLLLTNAPKIVESTGFQRNDPKVTNFFRIAVILI